MPGSLSSHLVLSITNRISSLRYIIQDIGAADKASIDSDNPPWVNDTDLMLDGLECLLEVDLIVSTAVKISNTLQWDQELCTRNKGPGR